MYCHCWCARCGRDASGLMSFVRFGMCSASVGHVHSVNVCENHVLFQNLDAYYEKP